MADSGAHVLIQDLEDFTPPPLRGNARTYTPSLFDRWRAAGARACMRINALDGEGPVDLAAAIAARADFIAYPKASTAAEMKALDRAISGLEPSAGLPAGSVGIVPVCETALGVVAIREMAAASPRVRYALLGAEDLAADLMAVRTPEATELDYARKRFLLECRAAGIEPIDAPYTFTDGLGASREARASRGLGYRAKSLVRVDHVGGVMAALVPGPAEREAARRLIQAFEAARERGEDRALVDGLWVEVPAYLNAKRLLAQPD